MFFRFKKQPEEPKPKYEIPKEPTLKEKREKQLQTMIYAIENYPQINRHKLMLYIFNIDLFCYNNYGYTILEDVYVRLSTPVPLYGFYLTMETGNMTDEEKEKYQKDIEKLKEGYNPESEEQNQSL